VREKKSIVSDIGVRRRHRSDPIRRRSNIRHTAKVPNQIGGELLPVEAGFAGSQIRRQKSAAPTPILTRKSERSSCNREPPPLRDRRRSTLRGRLMVIGSARYRQQRSAASEKHPVGFHDSPRLQSPFERTWSAH